VLPAARHVAAREAHRFEAAAMFDVMQSVRQRGVSGAAQNGGHTKHGQIRLMLGLMHQVEKRG
jgi:hypothetical protein